MQQAFEDKKEELMRERKAKLIEFFSISANEAGALLIDKSRGFDLDSPDSNVHDPPLTAEQLAMLPPQQQAHFAQMEAAIAAGGGPLAQEAYPIGP